ncbi:MAG: acyltransferase, partial [Legionellales bacterium]|nr:acyltransferase [Legionellales bacterium]
MDCENINFKYRPDIDGLRAIAILSIIIYHMNDTLITGGFVGVDIFFVISGYLISLQTFKEINYNIWSIKEFYRRRIKRIIPALFVLIITVLVFSQQLMLPNDALKTAKSSIWALFSVANFYFWLHLDTSYFAPASTQVPLLHLWTIGVEEQFYLFWPLITVFIYKINQRYVFFSILIILAITSFIFSEWFYFISPKFTYYMLPARVGEFIIGILAAGLVFNYHYIKIPKKICCCANLLGTILIFASLIFLHENDIFPGFRAIFPTIGTSLLILSGYFNTGGLTVKLLSNKVMKFIGKISYSAYLWHWPLLAFYRYANFEVTMFSGIFLLVLTIFISYLSYRYIEQPFRKTDKSFWKILLGFFIIPAIVLGLITLIFIRLDGFGLRSSFGNYSNKYKELTKKTEHAGEDRWQNVCQYEYLTKQMTKEKRCLINPEFISDNKKILLVGDSNAAHYVGLLTEFAKAGNFSFRNIAVSSCIPILDTKPDGFFKPKIRKNCINALKIIRSVIKEYDVLILAARWPKKLINTDSGENLYDNLFNVLHKLADSGKRLIIMG